MTQLPDTGLKSVAVTDTDIDISEFGQAQEVFELREALRRTQVALSRSKKRVDELVDATISSARDAVLSMGPIKITPPKPTKQSGKPEVALWDLGDFQGGKLTTSYNSEVMSKRVHMFVDHAIEITDIQRSHHPVTDCAIIFGGDMVEGLFNFPTQPFEIDSTIFAQYVQVSKLLVEVVSRALTIYDRVTVVAEWGNHGRIGSKRAAVPRSDNTDRMCYELARQLLAGESRLTWNDCPEDIQRLQIGEYRAIVLHGDEIGRNGFASQNTIVNHVNRWRSGAYPWSFLDCYVHHYHHHYEQSLADGRGHVYGTGSTESDNRYASIGLASAGHPSQRLHFIDPRKGRVSAQYQVYLD